MGITKSEIFTTNQNELAEIFKVLSNPGRLAILQYISAQNACICNDIVAEIGLAQPTISQHLKELKRLHLIKGTIEGTKICYCINEERWKKLQKNIELFLNTTAATCC